MSKPIVCPTCGQTKGIVGHEYAEGPNRYDGISEWQCSCGTCWGRWTGRILKPGEEEPKFGLSNRPAH